MRDWLFNIRKSFAVLCLSLLVACSGGPAYQQTLYTPPATPGGRLCLEQCGKSRDYCRQSCDLDNRACYNEVQTAAQTEYDKYARERLANHFPVGLVVSDFEHPGKCVEAKKSCFASCDTPYQSCYRECGGKVTVLTSCQFLCFE